MLRAEWEGPLYSERPEPFSHQSWVIIILPCFSLPILPVSHLFTLTAFSVGWTHHFLFQPSVKCLFQHKITVEQFWFIFKDNSYGDDSFLPIIERFLVLGHMLGPVDSKCKMAGVSIPILEQWFLEAVFRDRVFASSTVSREDTTVGNWVLSRRLYLLLHQCEISVVNFKVEFFSKVCWESQIQDIHRVHEDRRMYL